MLNKEETLDSLADLLIAMILSLIMAWPWSIFLNKVFSPNLFQLLFDVDVVKFEHVLPILFMFTYFYFTTKRNFNK